MQNTQICPECFACLIAEEFGSHSCKKGYEIDYQTGIISFRNREGKWSEIAIPDNILIRAYLRAKIPLPDAFGHGQNRDKPTKSRQNPFFIPIGYRDKSFTFKKEYRGAVGSGMIQWE